jgi:ABC-type Fe3+-hydroxamate transport system substrate-binding protein
VKFIDQTGHSIELGTKATRIVSLVPSQTELLAHFQLHDETVGITKFCLLPQQWFESKSRIGGTKTVNLEKLRSLKPDLILANKEENDREQVETLKEEFPVWTSDIADPEDSLAMIRSVGNLTGKQNEAEKLAKEIEEGLSSMSTFDRMSALYLVWNEPMMVAGTDTFINSMMRLAGFENMIEHPRYPEYEAGKSSPDVVLLPSEPFPFGEKHLQRFREMFPSSKIMLVDGQMFSWYGSRMLHFPEYIRELRQLLQSQ